MSISLRRAPRLQQCAQPDSTFAMLAMDQRSLLKAINPDNPASVPRIDVLALNAAIGALSPHASATLMDVEYGYGTCVASGALSGNPACSSHSKSGYDGDPTERRTKLLDDWSVGHLRRAATGIKLLVYYHPDAPNAADQEGLVRR